MVTFFTWVQGLLQTPQGKTTGSKKDKQEVYGTRMSEKLLFSMLPTAEPQTFDSWFWEATGVKWLQRAEWQ